MDDIKIKVDNVRDELVKKINEYDIGLDINSTLYECVDAVAQISENCTRGGTATAGDILNGKTAYVNGVKITGTITTVSPTKSGNVVTVKKGIVGEDKTLTIGTAKAAATYTPSTSNQTIAADTYLSGVQTIKGDTNLVAANIKPSVSIFGVSGTFTNDATATAAGIMKGKTAWAKGSKLTGTLETVTATMADGTVTVPAGYIAKEQKFYGMDLYKCAEITSGTFGESVLEVATSPGYYSYFTQEDATATGANRKWISDSYDPENWSGNSIYYENGKWIYYEHSMDFIGFEAEAASGDIDPWDCTWYAPAGGMTDGSTPPTFTEIHGEVTGPGTWTGYKVTGYSNGFSVSNTLTEGLTFASTAPQVGRYYTPDGGRIIEDTTLIFYAPLSVSSATAKTGQTLTVHDTVTFKYGAWHQSYDGHITFNCDDLPQGASPFTLSIWARSYNHATDRAIFAIGGTPIDNGNNLVQIQHWSDNKFRVAAMGGGSTTLNYTSNTKVGDGQWHHICVTYDGTTMRMYADGVLDGSVSTTLKINGTNGSIGCGYWGGDCTCGQFKCAMIYNRALSASEVAALAEWF